MADGLGATSPWLCLVCGLSLEQECLGVPLFKIQNSEQRLPQQLSQGGVFVGDVKINLGEI